jgi:hypothetical protein
MNLLQVTYQLYQVSSRKHADLVSLVGKYFYLLHGGLRPEGYDFAVSQGATQARNPRQA